MANTGFNGDVSPKAAWDALAGNPDAILLDVRTVAEWAFVGNPDLSSINKQVYQNEWAKFPGMVSNPAFVDEFKASGIETHQPVYIICRSGVRSRSAAELLASEGYETYNVADGFEGQLGPDGHRGAGGWKALGLPWKQS
uniref:rhodanese-like domain-containing protein n=1 Tax=Castellaniella defragrans TaxID=75697 RepID=UPI00333E6808